MSADEHFSPDVPTDEDDGMDPGFRYMSAGWGAVPLPPREKKPPAPGCTGHGAVDFNGPDYMAWREDGAFVGGNLGIRMPDDVIGLDVDHYGAKRGGLTLERLEADLGELPATWRSSARSGDVGGIRFFRAPRGLAWEQGAGAGIDVIQRMHRYAVVWPSIHPEGGQYRWTRPDGTPAIGEIPRVDDLPMLPDAWVAAFSKGERVGDAAVEALGADETIQWLEEFPNHTVCGMLRSATETHLAQFAELDGASAHDMLVRAYGHLIRLALEGHLGVLVCLKKVGRAFVGEVTGAHRGTGGARRLSVQTARVESRSVLRWSAGAHKDDPRIEDCRCAESMRPTPPAGADAAGPTRIAVGNEVSTIRAVRLALGTGSLQGVFRRGQELIRVPSMMTGAWTGGDLVQTISSRHALHMLLIEHAYMFRTDDQGNPVEGAIPREWLADVLSNVDMLPNIRDVQEIVTTPVFLRDGSLLQEPGYADGVLYLPPAGYEGLLAPEKPTKKDVKRAVKLLDHLLVDYSFCSVDARANYIALQLAPIVRRMLDHPLPLGVLTAPSKGSGKTYLGEGLKELHGGNLFGGLSGPEELAKRITSALLSPGGVTVFDNVKSTVASEALETVLTSSVVRDRVLGTQRTVELTNRRLWVITSNNATISEDIARRACVVEIDPGVEKPHLRDGFTIQDWPGYVVAHREEIVVALLTLVQYAMLAGPVPPARRADSFGGFVALAQHVLTTCGIPGEVMSAASSAGVSSVDSEDFQEFLHALKEVCEADLIAAGGFTLRELIDVSRNNGGLNPGARRLVDLLDEYGSAKGASPSARALGRWLTRWTGYVADGMVIRKRIGHRKTLIWSLESGGDGGNSLPPGRKS